MSATSGPYSKGERPTPASANIAYLPVRVTKEPRSNGSTTVFRLNGTALDVRTCDLVRFDSDAARQLGAVAEPAG